MGRTVIKRKTRYIGMHMDEDLYQFLKTLVETRECASIAHAIKYCVVKEIERRKYV